MHTFCCAHVDQALWTYPYDDHSDGTKGLGHHHVAAQSQTDTRHIT